MDVLVIGNGSTGVDFTSNKFYINNHTGNFLYKINEKFRVGFGQFTTPYSINSNLQNYDIKANDILTHNLPNWKHPLFIFKLTRLLLRYDFIYIFYPGVLGTIVGVLSNLLNKKFGLYVRGEYFNRNCLDRFVLNNSEVIYTISPSFATELKKFCKHVETIKPMINITKNDFKVDREYNSTSLVRLLFVGRVEEAKGIYEIVEISKILKFHNIPFVFDIVGGGDLYSSIMDILVNEHLHENVILYGQIADKHELKMIYEKADIFIFTSHHEGFPRVLYEAMASALPIFTTFVGGIPGRMEHLYNCIELPAKDGVGAAEIIMKYMNNSSVKEFIGKQGQNTVMEIIDGPSLKHEDLLLNYLNNER